jgi:hypothetical protein
MPGTREAERIHGFYYYCLGLLRRVLVNWWVGPLIGSAMVTGLAR